MEQASVYRKASVERISSPEQLNDYFGEPTKGGRDKYLLSEV